MYIKNLIYLTIELTTPSRLSSGSTSSPMKVLSYADFVVFFDVLWRQNVKPMMVSREKQTVINTAQNIFK